MKNLEIVITMGGLGSRFRKAGYTVPKYMIKAKGKTLFEWSMLSLQGFETVASQYIFIVLRDEQEDVECFIRKQCEKLGIEKYHIIVLDALTDGQATTAMLAEPYWSLEKELLIYNIDTYVEPGAMNDTQLKGDGFIPCFQGEGDHWSFVRLDHKGKVVEIKEKKRISEYCTLGAYYFKSCRLYADLYKEYYGNPTINMVGGEKYIAPMYDFLLKKGGELFITDIPVKKVHVLGTPEELREFLKKCD